MPDAHILVVDDDPAQLAILARVLAHARPEWSITAGQADAAWLAALAADPRTVCVGVDLVLLDHRLGSVSALDLLPAFAERAVPVVVMTGSLGSVDSAACCAAGAVAVVAKPYGLAEAAQVLDVCDQAIN
ncbi:MAG: response regulator [Planctomycetota bacterium]|nr:response regulator [Planctomycetota bacterium]